MRSCRELQTAFLRSSLEKTRKIVRTLLGESHYFEPDIIYLIQCNKLEIPPKTL